MVARETAAGPIPQPVFATTHWSVVLAAQKTSDAKSSAALEELCRTYWYPIYSYIRRRGYSPDDAQDLTQEFFARLLAGKGLDTVGPWKGRFRSFLLASVNHLLSDERDRAMRQKRGGGQLPFSFDAQTGEERYCLEPAHAVTPERIFEKRWAVALVEQVIHRMEADYSSGDKAGLFSVLKEFLPGEEEDRSYAATAQRLGMTEGAVRVAVHRLRQRFGELFRQTVVETLESPEELEAEMHYLLTVLNESQ